MDLSRYRKIIIYVLTFLAYAWSGYGAGLLANLRDAVLAAETVFQDLFANAITVAKKIKDIHEVFDAAVEEHCVFRCPDGAYTPDAILIRQRRGYRVILQRRAAIGRFRRSIRADLSLAFNCTFYTPFLSPVPFVIFLERLQIPINLINDLSIHMSTKH